MPPSRASSAKGALRFCSSCGVTLVCWTVWLGLGASLAMLGYVAVAEELPVPGFVLRKIETELAKADLSIRFGRARLDPNGQVLLENVALHTRRFPEPLVTSRLVYVRRNFWSVLAGRPIPDEIRLEGATVQVPAMLSPSGSTEPILRDVVLSLTHSHRLWNIHQFTAQVGPLSILAEGQIQLPPRPAGKAPLTINELANRFLKISRNVATQTHRLDPFEHPVLQLHFQHREETGNTVDAVLGTRGVENPLGQPLTLGDLVATATLSLDRAGPQPVELHAAIRRATYREDYSAGHVRTVLNAEISLDTFSFKPLAALVAAGEISGRGETMHGSVLHVESAKWPALRTRLATQIRGEFLAAEVDAQLAEKSARLRAEGRISHELISAVLNEITPRAAPYFVFGDPVAFRAEAALDPGWKFARLRSYAEGGRLDSRGVPITELRGRVDIDGTRFLAHDAIVRLGDNYARGSYWMDFITTDYRMLLDGQLQPLAINGWFRGDWWSNFWLTHFDFATALPRAEIDLQGRWKEVRLTTYFGRAEGPSARIFGADFTDVNTLIFLRPNYTHALEISGKRAGGQQELSGWFKRFADDATGATDRIEFAADSTVDADTYLKLTKGKAAVVFDGLKTKRPARLHAEGVIAGIWPNAVPTIQFTGSAAGGLHFYDFPLDTVQVTGSYTGTSLQLPSIKLTAAGGRGAGHASLTGPADARVLAFAMKVDAADLPSAIRATTEFQARRAPAEKTVSAENDFIKRAAGGKLDIALTAQGKPGDLANFTGTGTTALTGANLGEIQLFGLLSQALSGMSLNFSSLKLDTARSSLRLGGGKLYFPDVKISGSGAIIDARGDYTFSSSQLDFSAKLKPFGENRNILTAAIGLVINPLTSILELKLTGPVSKPDWSVVVSASSLKPEVPPTSPEAPVLPVIPETPAQPKP